MRYIVYGRSLTCRRISGRGGGYRDVSYTGHFIGFRDCDVQYLGDDGEAIGDVGGYFGDEGLIRGEASMKFRICQSYKFTTLLTWRIYKTK